MLTKNVFLVGFMGSGKSTAGRLAAKRLNCKFVDIGDHITWTELMPIPRIFEEYGESYFRTIESMILKNFSQRENSIVATGGGIIKKNENIKTMKQSGVIIYLRVSPEMVAARTEGDLSRPLLNTSDKLDTIKTLMGQRQPLYEGCADYIIDCETLDAEGVADIIAQTADRLRMSK